MQKSVPPGFDNEREPVGPLPVREPGQISDVPQNTISSFTAIKSDELDVPKAPPCFKTLDWTWPLIEAFS